MKEEIRQFVLDMGVDAAGFAAASDYVSPRSPRLDSIFPHVRSLVVLAYRELDSCESANPYIAMNGRLDLMSFSRSCNYRLSRHLERTYRAKTMTVPASYPMEMSRVTKGTVGEVSLRHAAVAAGLGAFGRHNLVVHPELGSRAIFTAVLTDLPLFSDAHVADVLCTDCGLCVRNCPGKAIEVEGKTDVMKCLRSSQPYGLGGTIAFWSRHSDASPEERKEMLRDDHFWRLYQAGFVGLQYFCFSCIGTCPAGRRASGPATS